jgi:hypothetical protein
MHTGVQGNAGDVCVSICLYVVKSCVWMHLYEWGWIYRNWWCGCVRNKQSNVINHCRYECVTVRREDCNGGQSFTRGASIGELSAAGQ